MNADRRRSIMRQDLQPEPDQIPLRDISPSASAVHEPSNEDWRKEYAQNQSQDPTGMQRFTKKGRLIQAGVAGDLEKHPLALVLITVYALIAVLSWSITCILSYKPIGVPTYFDQSGNYSRTHYEMTDNWRKAASVGQSVVGAISIPVTSAICAKAVAVYCQRKSDARTPSLSLRQMLVLADKGWVDIATLLDVMRPSTSRRMRSPLLVFSFGLVAIGFGIPVIQTSVVSIEHVSVVSQQDKGNQTILGYQITPQMLREISNETIMDNVISSTLTGKLNDMQPFLWSSDQSRSNLSSIGQYITNYNSFEDIPSRHFIAALPVGTDSGVLRDLALRLNISISCDLVSQSDFPSPCPGPFPLDQTFTNINASTTTPFGDMKNPKYRARVCAPGNISSSPWNDTAHRQDISEEFWLDYQRTSTYYAVFGIEDQGRNYTLHCYGNSTLGYFELPNYWNGHVSGPLLDKDPPNGPNLTYQDGDPLQLTAGDSINTPTHGVPGPFLTAILATFGPHSFFTTTGASSNITRANSTLSSCHQLRYPFTSLADFKQEFPSPTTPDIDWTPSSPTLNCDLPFHSEDPTPLLANALMNWMPNFGDKERATAALTLATYAAGNAILKVGSEGDFAGFLYTSPGTNIQKPKIAFAGVVIVSLLLAMQIISLTLLAFYASRNVTWTSSLDSFAMLRLGAEIGTDNLPAVSALEAKNAKILDEQKGWVGDTEFESREDGIEVRELGLGGQGRVRDGVLYRMTRLKDEEVRLRENEARGFTLPMDIGDDRTTT